MAAEESQGPVKDLINIEPRIDESTNDDDQGPETALGQDATRTNSTAPPSPGMLEEAVSAELRQIATALSKHLSRAPALASAPATPKLFDANSALDPGSANFDVTKWVRSFVSQLREQGHRSSKLSVLFRDLEVFGSGSSVQLQDTVGSILLSPLRARELLATRKQQKQILHGFNGLLKSGELLAVLGRPGSGCSTFLKTICGELDGLALGERTTLHYNGTPHAQMKEEFKGEVIYNEEVDKHFPHLTVGQTLEFAAAMRTPSQRIAGMSRSAYCRYIARVVMAVFGLSHTRDTKMGSDYVRGVSGGERKRVSIAEMLVAGSPICAWDNSTRGLDAASALKFVQALRLSSNLGGHAHAVAMYQASQAIYDVFDKATVLYEGRQIYFGPAASAKSYFERQGWQCPPRQTTGDFLTSVTNPDERTPRPGMEHRVPRTAEDFERHWLSSPEFTALHSALTLHDSESTTPSTKRASLLHLRATKHHRQSKHLLRPSSPYNLSLPAQLHLLTTRAYHRLWNDRTAALANLIACLVLALVIGSVFYTTPHNATAGFDAKGSVLFMSILLNALTAIAEIEGLFGHREVVRKQASWAFYHPAAEAAAGVVADAPVRLVSGLGFSVVVYFMSGLRREVGGFFLFFGVSYVAALVMTGAFRTVAAVTRSVAQAMAGAGVLVLGLVMYTGYIIPVPQMHPWFSWIRWLNPIYYAFEILVANEFHGREFQCSLMVPPYSPPVGDSWICGSLGAVAGRATVNGDAYIVTAYGYTYDHVWRNFGILLAFLVGVMAIYFAAVELNSSVTSTAEALVFRRGHAPAHLHPKSRSKDEERGPSPAATVVESDSYTQGPKSAKLEPQKDVFTWKDVVYDIDVKDGKRCLLDHVSGWVKPGALTALMGASGAGKTTLLDVLAQRTTVGVITGDMLVNGRTVGADLQRQTGYVQQQDLHLDTATVRESLRFSAMLRRAPSISKKEKYDYVEEIIEMLGMQDYANAVVGVPGEGLNGQQRKLLTIGVELVAKPQLLLFLDEPTSGLDSQSAWAICAFLRKLADAGQAVLCTIHQPNAVLFQQFDRLLFLANGGKTVYFGDIGVDSRCLLDYFERHGARHCGDDENPAEYMLEIVAGVNSAGEDWHAVWTASEECKRVGAEIEQICKQGQSKEKQPDVSGRLDTVSGSEFAMPFYAQALAVTQRIFTQYWRMPHYVLPKLGLGMFAGLFIGFTFFRPDATLAGMRDVVFSVFMLTTVFTTLVEQIQPLFVTQRALYETRERPSKTYSWQAFLLANTLVEIPSQLLTGALTFATFYYPITGTNLDPSRQALTFLFITQLFLYATAFAHMTIAALPDPQTATAVVVLLTMLSTIFSGVLQPRDALPAVWRFVYRASPFTYWVGGVVSAVLHGREVTCAEAETLALPPPGNMTCLEYLAPLAGQAEVQGTLLDPGSREMCRYCAYDVADQWLEGVDIFWEERWRNFGIVWAYVVFDVAAAVGLYYVFRVKGVRIQGLLRKFKRE